MTNRTPRIGFGHLLASALLCMAAETSPAEWPAGVSPASAELLSPEWPSEQRHPLAPFSPAAIDWIGGGAAAPWKPIGATEGGGYELEAPWWSTLRFRIESDAPRTLMLRAAGVGRATFNGALRSGETYREGAWWIPVRLEAGANEWLLSPRGGEVWSPELREPRAAVELFAGDLTLPMAEPGAPEPLLASVALANTTTETIRGASVRSSWQGGELLTTLPDLPPLMIRKDAFLVAPPGLDAERETSITLELLGPDGSVWDRGGSTIFVASSADDLRVRTFRSRIDDTVQKYAVRPVVPAVDGIATPPALVFSLHGAAVDATNQAAAYASKSWAVHVAPTNRRPYGFDWEDWGRLDALEVLELALANEGADPSRVVLTGHSMGGHGTWHLGSLYPDRFAAVGPSAGWISRRTYPREQDAGDLGAAEQLLWRTFAGTDPRAMIENFRGRPIYAIHGDADDNVPAEQTERMLAALKESGIATESHIERGAGHWWDGFRSHGADCLDWPPLFDLFAKTRLPAPAEVRRVRFITPNPAVSPSRAWLTIRQQERQLEPSRADLDLEPAENRLSGTLENVAAFEVDLAGCLAEGPVSGELNGAAFEVPWPADRRLRMRRDGAGWTPAERWEPADKGPHRSGPFQLAFQNRMVLVHGTQGSEQEDLLGYERARYDAELFAYQGNGTPLLLSDTEFLAGGHAGRNVILYGNADLNSAWAELRGDCGVEFRNGRWSVGDLACAGDEFAGFYAFPRRDDDAALVGVVAWTGERGRRVSASTMYLRSGVAMPDVLVLDPRWFEGSGAGLVAAGYFGNDWSVAGGEFARGAAE
ncbi:MAG: prolyl oligopeptidase family serine peptidase [Candidatus Sumerlaeia bacterium]|nr:prolyl oligopeptidase family serine peptidase [Candidatus Sumerlaeia bacterium]